LKGASGLTTIKTVNSDNVSSGEKIVGIGNAEGLGGTPSYVAGTVVALDQAITAGDETNPAGSEHLNGLIEVNAAIVPGDSGGPLVNDKGEVVGMDTAAQTSTAASVSTRATRRVTAATRSHQHGAVDRHVDSR